MIIVDAPTITALAAMFTAIAASVSPSVAAYITSKSESKRRINEMNCVDKNKSISSFVSSYGKLRFNSDIGPYIEFVSASYQLLSFVVEKPLQEQISLLITEIHAPDYSTTPNSDKLFCDILDAIAAQRS